MRNYSLPRVVPSTLPNYDPEFLLDLLTSYLAASYSVSRKILIGQQYAIRVRDDTLGETDVGFVNGELDTAGMLAWGRRNLLGSIPLGIDVSPANGISDGWLNQAGLRCTITNTVEDGAQKITLSEYVSGTAYGGVKKIITCVAGAIITATVKYKTSDVVDGLKVGVLITTNIGSLVGSTSIAPSNDYTTYTVTGTCPVGTTVAQFYLYAYCASSGSGSAWFKDATLTISNQSQYITALYDAIGNNNYVVQMATINQPRIVSLGIVDMDGGKPCAIFDGVDDCLVAYNRPMMDILAQPLYLNAVVNASAQGYVICTNDASTTSIQYALLIGNATKATTLYLNGTANNIAIGANNSVTFGAKTLVSAKWENDVMQVYANGVASGTTDTYSDALSSRVNFTIGARSSAADGSTQTTFITCKLHELHVMKGNPHQARMESNQRKYYGIGG